MGHSNKLVGVLMVFFLCLQASGCKHGEEIQWVDCSVSLTILVEIPGTGSTFPRDVQIEFDGLVGINPLTSDHFSIELERPGGVNGVAFSHFAIEGVSEEWMEIGRSQVLVGQGKVDLFRFPTPQIRIVQTGSNSVLELSNHSVDGESIILADLEWALSPKDIPLVDLNYTDPLVAGLNWNLLANRVAIPPGSDEVFELPDKPVPSGTTCLIRALTLDPDSLHPSGSFVSATADEFSDGFESGDTSRWSSSSGSP